MGKESEVRTSLACDLARLGIDEETSVAVGASLPVWLCRRFSMQLEHRRANESAEMARKEWALLSVRS